MKKVIVSTSINKPTEAIKKFDSLKDWLLIVVGDKKTPKNYKLKNGIYLSVKDQKLIDKKLSDIIGWNCIERRNLGLVFAKNLAIKSNAYNTFPTGNLDTLNKKGLRERMIKLINYRYLLCSN